MKIINADHLKSRINTPTNEKEAELAIGIISFIDSEPEISKDSLVETMKWVKKDRVKKTKDVNTVTHGVECDACGQFELYERRYCPNCGRRFDGKIDNIYRKFRR